MGAHTPWVSTKWVRAPGGPYFHNSWFAFKKGQPLVTLIVTFDCVLWSAAVFRHCSALFSGLKSLLHNGCSWCICCFCIVISYCSIKIIENNKNYISEDTGLKRHVFSTKWVCIPPWSLQNGRACPHGLYFHVHVLFFFAQSSGSIDGDDVSYPLWFASVSTHSGVLLSGWSLYTMGVHCACVVCALLFNIVPVKSSNTDEDHLSIWYSNKKRFSLQNGFAWGTSYPEKVAIIPSGIILWNFHVLSCVWFLFFTKKVFWNSKRSPKVLYKMTPGVDVFPVCDFCSLQKGFLGIQRGHFEIQRGHPRFFTKWPLGIFRCPKIWPQFWLYWFILMVFFWQTVPLYKMGTLSFLNLCPTTKWDGPAKWGWTYPTCRNTLLGTPLGPLQNAPPPTPRGKLTGGSNACNTMLCN